MKYEVSIVVDGRFYVNVEANSPEEAKELGEIAFQEATCGDVECIDWFVQHVVDEDDKYTDSFDN